MATHIQQQAVTSGSGDDIITTETYMMVWRIALIQSSFTAELSSLTLLCDRQKVGKMRLVTMALGSSRLRGTTVVVAEINKGWMDRKTSETIQYRRCLRIL